MPKTNYKTRPPAKQYYNCSVCGSDTLLAFSNLKYYDYVISLCGPCAMNQVKLMLDLTTEGSALETTLQQLTKKGNK